MNANYTYYWCLDVLVGPDNRIDIVVNTEVFVGMYLTFVWDKIFVENIK